ncbi:CLUMA_CG007426, isoform A [Clunio marinus]|uniref:CLUMA_CG007426, isoform A n=1 Tax=Clunio marinus TaxID=568069 RepID=A0A1J1I118_9DIPT|nr:CLUMA_CG007426, isoform A [Clunio marinus]
MLTSKLWNSYKQLGLGNLRYTLVPPFAAAFYSSLVFQSTDQFTIQLQKCGYWEVEIFLEELKQNIRFMLQHA